MRRGRAERLDRAAVGRARSGLPLSAGREADDVRVAGQQLGLQRRSAPAEVRRPSQRLLRLLPLGRRHRRLLAAVVGDDGVGQRDEARAQRAIDPGVQAGPSTLRERMAS